MLRNVDRVNTNQAMRWECNQASRYSLRGGGGLLIVNVERSSIRAFQATGAYKNRYVIKWKCSFGWRNVLLYLV